MPAMLRPASHGVRTPEQTQALISDWRAGDHSARDMLIARLLPELKQIAAARLRKEDSSSLSTYDLVNEAVARILEANGKPNNRSHFLALASHLMRNILVDHARARSAGKREHRKVELNTIIEGEGPLDLFELNSALMRLEAIEPEYAEIVEMRFFGGMTVADIAEVTGWSEPTVKRRWQVARAWLADALDNPITDE